MVCTGRNVICFNTRFPASEPDECTGRADHNRRDQLLRLRKVTRHDAGAIGDQARNVHDIRHSGPEHELCFAPTRIRQGRCQHFVLCGLRTSEQ